jgi:asparagine synthase (glutamine-hydrolysing)
MCGIFGIIRRGGLRPEDRETLGRLARSLVHRGPDGEGFHVSGPVGIGMRRLAIIDLNGGWRTARSTTSSSCGRTLSRAGTASAPEATARRSPIFTRNAGPTR